MSNIRKIIFSFLMLILLCIIIIINVTTFFHIPDVVEFHYQNPDITQLVPKEIDSFQQANSITMTYSTFKQKNITALSGQTQRVTAIYTNKYYKELYPIQMIYGGFIVKENEIVISQALAEKLFLTSNAVGYMLQVDGENYQVCGVYKEDNSVMAQSFGDSRLFIPIQSEMKIDTLSFSGNQTAAYYRSLFSKDTAYKLSGYADVNILQEANILKLINRALILIFVSFFFIKILRKCIASFQKMRLGVKSSLEKMYFADAVKFNIKLVIYFVLPVGGCLLLLVAGLMTVAKPLVLPLHMMVSNIFDLTAYYRILVESIAKPNMLICPQAAYYLHYSQISIALYSLTVVFIPLVLFILPKRKGR